jgi:hypothetical protein
LGLIDMIRRLLGDGEPVPGDDAGFSCIADSDGINFVMERSRFDQIPTGMGGTLQRIQLVVLRMLQEQGFAQAIANGFHIPAEEFAALDDEQAEVLGAFSRFSGSFCSVISGRTGNSSFRVDLLADTPDGRAPFRRKGPLLYLGANEAYRLTPAELLGLQAWERHRDLEPECRSETENVRLMAMLQTAARSGMRIDLAHFDRMDVVVPDSIGVNATRLPDGSLLLCPSLGEGSTPEQLERRWSQLDLDATGGVLRVGNRVLLLDPDKLAGIKEVLGNKRIPADRVAEFMATPSAFLDAALVNLEIGFSLRVAGIGRLQHLDFGGLADGRRDWFAVEGQPLPPASIPGFIQSHEELERFVEVYDAARGQGAETLDFDGSQIDIADRVQVDEQIARIRQALEEPPPEPVREAPPSGELREQVSVILRETDDIVESLLHKARSASPSKAPAWDTYLRSPFPHQREGVEWILGLLDRAIDANRDDIYRLQGGLLADDMGLGKTYMSLVCMAEYLERLKAAGQPQKPLLVVAPLSLLDVWEDEVRQTFRNVPFRDVVVLQTGRDLKRFRIQGMERESVQLSALVDDEGAIDADVIRYALAIGPDAGSHRLDMDRRLVLATYQTLRDYQFSLCRIDWGIVVFDEAQNIKNPNALQTRAAKGLKADFKLLATGTPVENSLADFWCLMDTAQPGILGGWHQFRDRWIKPILNAEEGTRDAIRREVGAGLRNAVGAFMLRRIKEDQLKGLPTKSIHSGVPQSAGGPQQYAPHLSAMMTGIQLQAYDSVLHDYRSRRGAEDLRGSALAALVQLREVSLHPRLRDPGSLMCPDASSARATLRESGKLAATLAVIDRIREQGEKALLFMITKRLQRALKIWLDQIYGLDIGIVNGDTVAVVKRPDELTRKQLIAAFEARSGFNLLIMSPVAAGVGLTVVGANHVVHLERHWNPAKEAQASDRVYRIGQKKEVHIHLPAVLHPEYDSFDVHLDKLLRSKLVLKDAVVTPEAVSETEMMQAMGL